MVPCKNIETPFSEKKILGTHLETLVIVLPVTPYHIPTHVLRLQDLTLGVDV